MRCSLLVPAGVLLLCCSLRRFQRIYLARSPCASACSMLSDTLIFALLTRGKQQAIFILFLQVPLLFTWHRSCRLFCFTASCPLACCVLVAFESLFRFALESLFGVAVLQNFLPVRDIPSCPHFGISVSTPKAWRNTVC